MLNGIHGKWYNVTEAVWFIVSNKGVSNDEDFLKKDESTAEIKTYHIYYEKVFST